MIAYNRFRRALRLFRQRPFWGPRMFWQRGRTGWAVEDTWSLDTYLAKILSGSLACLADNLHGCPSRFCGDTYEEIQNADIDERTKEWGRLLREAAAGFATYEIGEERTPELERALAFVGEWFGDLWD